MANTKETVQLATPGQKKEIAAVVAGAMVGVLEKLTHRQAQFWIGKKGRLAFQVENVLLWLEYHETQEILKNWQAFYRRSLSIERDFTCLYVPPYREGFDCLIVVAAGITSELVLEKLGNGREVHKYLPDLNTVRSKRQADKDYVIRIRGDQEANKESRDEDLPAMTLEERLLLQLKSHSEAPETVADMETWDLPDCQSATLCEGSWDSSGFHPAVYSDRQLRTHVVCGTRALNLHIRRVVL